MEKEDEAKVAEVNETDEADMLIPTSFYEQIKNERKGKMSAYLASRPVPMGKLKLFECSGYAEMKLVKTGRVALVDVKAVVTEPVQQYRLPLHVPHDEVEPNSLAVGTFYEFDVLDTYLEIPGGARFDDPPAAELAKLVEKRIAAFNAKLSK